VSAEGPTSYPNSSNVHIKNQTQPDLRLATEFRWKTFGVTIDFTVLEFVRHERLVWEMSAWPDCFRLY